jgi:integrase
MKRFCAFLADHFRMEKLANISGKHIEAYVSQLQERGRSAAYIKTELSAIRLFHDLMPDPRYTLPSNDTLGLERRRFGEVDRTWTEQEYEVMRKQAERQGHDDFADMLALIWHTGLRLHECARLDTAAAEGAIRSGLLTVKGKGGKVRGVPVDIAVLEVLRRRMASTRRGCKLFIPDDAKTDAVMGALEQFIIRNREDGRATGAALTIHGLRHTWAAERYRELVAAGSTPYEARKQVSQWLGHERDSVTKIYLASLSEAERKGGGSI